jgi:anti-anti-sigma regulatory factor
MDNLQVLELHGDIDVSRKFWIEGELDTLENLGPQTRAIIDLTQVPYLDTTFLNALMRVNARLAKDRPGVHISLVASRENIIWRLFDILKLNAAFDLFDNMASARASQSSLAL